MTGAVVSMLEDVESEEVPSEFVGVGVGVGVGVEVVLIVVVIIFDPLHPPEPQAHTWYSYVPRGTDSSV